MNANLVTMFLTCEISNGSCVIVNSEIVLFLQNHIFHSAHKTIYFLSCPTASKQTFTIHPIVVQGPFHLLVYMSATSHSDTTSLLHITRSYSSSVYVYFVAARRRSTPTKFSQRNTSFVSLSYGK